MGTWFKNVIQLSLWTVVLKLIVRVMLALPGPDLHGQANLILDILTIIAINVTFLVMVIASPIFTAEFISNHTIGPMAAVAASFFAAPAAILAKTIPGAHGLTLARAGIRYLKGKGNGTNTEAKKDLGGGKDGGTNTEAKNGNPGQGKGGETKTEARNSRFSQGKSGGANTEAKTDRPGQGKGGETKTEARNKRYPPPPRRSQ